MSVFKQFDHLRIQLETILSATNNFAEDHIIGEGGYGNVYKGEIHLPKGHTTVALKRLDRQYGQGDSEFWKEIMMLSTYKHENIISLLGYCDVRGEKIIAYEYASKGGLDSHLSNKDLTWVRRLMICVGAARGLAYLHDPAGTQQRVLHRDIKSSTILLDENWNAMIADFGLSKFGPANQQHTFIVTNNTAGTLGYCDPLYIESGILTKESDVYSFGVVLFEVLCGRLCITDNNDRPPSLTRLVRKHYKNESLNEIIFANIKDEIHPSSLKAFSTIAYRCLKRDHNKRPLMSDIVTTLEIALQYQPATSIKSSFMKEHLRVPPESMKDATNNFGDGNFTGQAGGYGKPATSTKSSFMKEHLRVPPELMKDATNNFGYGNFTGQAGGYGKPATSTKSSFMKEHLRVPPESMKDATNNFGDGNFTGQAGGYGKSTKSTKHSVMKEFEHLRLPLELIKYATNNFDDANFIARGGFGMVYRGDLGESVGAVKRLDRSKDRADVSFWSEIMLLSNYRHDNIISLLGFCDESEERIVVYEYALNKSLDLHLNDHNLTWIRRLNICIGAASGLEYLHNPKGTQQRVLHRDIKSGNILLDENWNAKIADFGLSRYGPANQPQTFLFSDAKGTLGYCDPEYLDTMVLTKESDVYSFGVVLFEVLCSRLCVEYGYDDQHRSLPRLVRKCYKEQTLDSIIDVNLRQQMEQNSLDTFISLAYQCLERDRTRRPSMHLVVSMLQTALKYQVLFEAKDENVESRQKQVVSEQNVRAGIRQGIVSQRQAMFESIAQKQDGKNREPEKEKQQFTHQWMKQCNTFHYS